MRGNIKIIGNLNEAKFDKDKKIIEKVALISKTSKNNRDYTDECLSGALPLFEGVKCYINHDKSGNTRSVKDLVGRYRNPIYENGKVKADLHLLNDGGEISQKLLAIIEQMPDLVGNSISARGRYHREDGRDIIEELTKVNSVDIVTDPATTSSLFESIEEIKEEDNMDLKSLTKDELKKGRNDIFEEVIKDGAESRNNEVKVLTEEIKTLKQKVDDYKVKESVIEKKENVQKILKESEIPEELVTEVFVESLNDAKDDAVVKKLIEDRKTVAKDLKAGVKNYGSDKKLDESKKKEVTDDDVDSCFTEEIREDDDE